MCIRDRAIAVQTGLSENQYHIFILDYPDDLDECYSKIENIQADIQSRFPDAEVIANFTGGTKVMSASLAFFGVMNPEWKLSLNIGKRKDIIKVTSGDVPVLINKWKIFRKQKIVEAKNALQRYDYEAALHVFEEFLMQPLEREYQLQLQEWINVCKAFSCWDRYNHAAALELISDYGRHYKDYILILKKLLKQDKNHHGYELVADLVNNAERKAAQGRYDDAVARLYRATELFGQIRLDVIIPQSELGRLKLGDLPENLQDDYKDRARENKQLLLGLCDVYTLLHRLHDSVGDIYQKMEKKVLDALYKRNNSIYAHGLRPLACEDYRVVKESLCGLLTKAAEAIGVDLSQAQLPSLMEDVD